MRVHEQAQDLDLPPHCMAVKEEAQNLSDIRAGIIISRCTLGVGQGAETSGSRQVEIIERLNVHARDAFAAPARCMHACEARTLLLHVLLLDLALVQDLDGHLMLGENMLRDFDLVMHCKTPGDSYGGKHKDGLELKDRDSRIDANTFPNDPLPRVFPKR